jgi:Helix-turn-helix domain
MSSADGFRSFNWIRGVADDKGISRDHRLILIRLLAHRYRDGQCNPGYSLLAAEVGVHRSTVIRAINIAVERGWLAEPRRGGGSGICSSFVFTFPVQNSRTDATVSSTKQSHQCTQNSRTSAQKQSQRKKASRAKSNTSRSNGQHNGQGERAHSVCPPPNVDVKKKPRASKRLQEPDAFPRFWSVYPKQIDKPKAEKEFAAALKRGVTVDEIIDGARRYTNDDERLARAREVGSLQFTKNPANWLRENGWTNHYSNGGTTIDQHGNEVVVARAPKASWLDSIPDDWDELGRSS